MRTAALCPTTCRTLFTPRTTTPLRYYTLHELTPLVATTVLYFTAFTQKIRCTEHYRVRCVVTLVRFTEYFAYTFTVRSAPSAQTRIRFRTAAYCAHYARASGFAAALRTRCIRRCCTRHSALPRQTIGRTRTWHARCARAPYGTHQHHGQNVRAYSHTHNVRLLRAAALHTATAAQHAQHA